MNRGVSPRRFEAVARHWKVRPYFVARGRTRTRLPLLMHTLVSVPRYDTLFAAGLAPEARGVYDAARQMSSVAELSAACGMPLGVTRVVIDDLAATDKLLIHSDERRSAVDTPILERVIRGLRNLT